MTRRASSARGDAIRRTGVREVAERAGVAASSVSRVLSEHPAVSSAMRDKVLAAARDLGYEPNLLAQSLRSGATMSVGFVVGDISNPLMAEIALGAEVTLRQSGYSMLLTNSGADSELDATHLRLLRQRRVDGILLSVADEDSPATTEELAQTDTPVVLVDRDPARLPGTSAVLSDHTAGLTQAVDALIKLGHTRIALVNGNPRVRPARERATVMRRVCLANGAKAIIRSGAFTSHHGEAATADLLRLDAPPTAIIAGGNQILAGVMRALSAAHARVPRDISLITCDDVPLAEFLTPPLSTIYRSPREIGQVAAEHLLAQLRGADPSFTVLPTGFRMTSSCAPPPATDPR